MYWFEMGIAQIALDPAPLKLKQANVEKSALNHGESPYTPR